MAAKKRKKPSAKRKPALTPKAREDQLINLAINLAEQQLRDGTASSQTINHYLKIGSTRETLENQKREKELALLEAKTEAIKSNKRIEELYEDALIAMRKYSGNFVNDEENLQ